LVSPPAGPVSIARFCALYALAVWTSPQWFIVGVVFFVATNLAPQVRRLPQPTFMTHRLIPPAG